MRVTHTMKNYIRKCVEKKVTGKLDAAKEAKKAQAEKNSEAIEAVKKYAESLIPEVMKKVVAFAKKRGLTWFEHVPTWHGVNENVNVAFAVSVDAHDFEETNPLDSNTADARKPYKKIEAEPGRIIDAVNEAVDAIVFSLELGKVKKAELEELIASTEVKV